MSRPTTVTNRSLTILLSLTVLLTSAGLAPAPKVPAPEAARAPVTPEGSSLPPGFTETGVTSIGSATLTALAFTPDGRMLITAQGGQLHVYENGALLPTPAVNFLTAWPARRICTDFERGLLGVAVDPDFTTNNYIYLYYTAVVTPTLVTNNTQCQTNGVGRQSWNVVNRVSRFTLSGNTVLTTTETILVDNMSSWGGNHNGGDLHFGNDGYLYITVGDGGTDYDGSGGSGGSNNASRDEFMLLGKVLRVTRDGDIPPANPFQGAGTARCNVTGRTTPGNRCQETFARGLRNPFRMAFDPNTITTRFFINDVGQNIWEEIDEGQSGADYGWNCREGAHTNSTTGPCNPTPPGMIDPIHEYNHSIGCNVITGGAFVPDGVWPATYTGHYLFADPGCNNLYDLAPNGGGYTRTLFGSGLNFPNHLLFGPYSNTVSLYYAGGNQVRRIDYNNQSPTAQLSAIPTFGPTPLLVTFDASGSSDPDGQPLTFDWDFGDGTILTSTTSLTTTHTYTLTGVFTATVVVYDTQGSSSAPASVQIQANNTPPQASILTPITSTLFAVGQAITLTGSAIDPQDGALSDSALTWSVLIHHIDELNPGNAHTHNYLPPTQGNAILFNAPPPEDLGATALSYLEIQLTATDSLGLATIITQTINPNRVNLTFNTAPVNLQLLISSQPYTASQTVVGWEAWGLPVEAPNQSSSPNQFWYFDNWSDGGAAAHTIITPGASTTYTATFTLANLLYLPLIRR